MTEAHADLEGLLTDVRKTISDNQRFLESLLGEAIESDSEADPEAAENEEGFEEL